MVISALKNFGVHHPLAQARVVRTVYLDTNDQEEWVEHQQVFVNDEIFQANPLLAKLVVIAHIKRLADHVNSHKGFIKSNFESTPDQSKGLRLVYDSLLADLRKRPEWRGLGVLTVDSLVDEMRICGIHVEAEHDEVSNNMVDVVRQLNGGKETKEIDFEYMFQEIMTHTCQLRCRLANGETTPMFLCTHCRKACLHNNSV